MACLRRALGEFSAIFIPGFIGRAEDGRTSLVGCGGSDLTALFLAQKLRANRCRLIKDVDGLYEADPNAGDGSRPVPYGAGPRPDSTFSPNSSSGPRSRRYWNVHWQDALRLDGGIVQHKAVRLAAEHGLSFGVAALPALAG